MHQHDGSPYLIRHFAFSSFGNIIPNNVIGSVLFSDVVLVEILDCVSIVEPKEGPLRCHKIRIERFDDVRSDWIVQEEVNNLANLRHLRLCDGERGTRLTMPSIWSRRSLKSMKTSSASR